MNANGLVILAAALLGGADAAKDNAAVMEVQNAVRTLNDLFVQRDADGIRRAMTEEHLAITPYYAGSLSLAEQLKSLSDHRLTEYGMGKITVTLLAKDLALVSYPLTLKGTYKERDVSGKYYVGAAWVNRDGKWLEVLYMESQVGLLGAQADADAVEKVLLKLERDWATALEKRDAKAIAPLLAKDFISVESDGSLLNKEQYLEARVTDQEIESSTLEQMQVRVYGHTATVMGLQTNQGKRKGQKVTERYRYVDAFILQDGTWKCVSTQVTPLPAKK